MVLSELEVNIFDAPGVSLGDLATLRRPFDVHYGCLDGDSRVRVFDCIIGQDRDLIHSRDSVKLASAYYQVPYSLD